MSELNPEELIRLANELEEASLKLASAARCIQQEKLQERVFTKEVLTVEEYAAETGYNEQHVRRMIRDGRVEAFKLEGGARWLIPANQLEPATA